MNIIHYRKFINDFFSVQFGFLNINILTDLYLILVQKVIKLEINLKILTTLLWGLFFSLFHYYFIYNLKNIRKNIF